MFSFFKKVKKNKIFSQEAIDISSNHRFFTGKMVERKLVFKNLSIITILREVCQWIFYFKKHFPTSTFFLFKLVIDNLCQYIIVMKFQKLNSCFNSINKISSFRKNQQETAFIASFWTRHKEYSKNRSSKPRKLESL